MEDHRVVIDRSLVLLCDLTNCNAQLLDKSMELGVLTRDELFRIERYPVGYSRNLTFYEVIRAKDTECFAGLMNAMNMRESRQSNRVLSILRSALPPYSILSEGDIKPIVRVMAGNADVWRRKQELYLVFGFHMTNYQDMTDPITFFTFLLRKWIEENSPPRLRSVDRLVHHLRSLEMNEVADGILILESNGSIGTLSETVMTSNSKHRHSK